ncbi:MAG: TolC family protein [Bacteroidetes bacterium]|nr:TolC family protein [Bacteroidota bacterium]
MKTIFFILSCFIILSISAQSVDIQLCYKKAAENYPLSRQKDMLNNMNDLKTKSLNTNYLPQLSLNGQMAYQSDVTKLNITIPNPLLASLFRFPEISKDSYKATLDVNQLIWDGGIISGQKKVEELSIQSELQNLESELYKLKEKVNLFYFNILILQQNIELLEVSKVNIQTKLTKVESGVKNGMVNENNADNLKAEIIKIDQKIIEAKSLRTANIQMLQELTTIEMNDKTSFILPETDINVSNFENQRPELKSFEINKSKLTATESVISSKLLPKIYGFGQIGYGRPGLNMLSNDFQSFYMVGAKLTWNLWNWNQTKTDKKIIEIQKNIINTTKESYQKNIKINYQKDVAEIEKFNELLVKDLEIIALRTKIAKNASSQFDNGYITSSDYLNDVNAETQAILNYVTHKIQLHKAKYDYLVNLGKL